MGFELHSDEGCDVAPHYDHTVTNYLDVGSLEPHNFAWIIAGACAFLATLLALYHIYLHLANYTKPEHQKHILRILLMVPIYAIDSFLSFRFYWISVYFDVVRDCYEAFVIHSFYCLLVEYVGGFEHGKHLISQRGELKLVPPLCCFKVEPKRGFMRQCKRLTLQYVVIRPSMTILAVILHSNSALCPGNFSPLHGYLYFMVVNFLSVTTAMYALVLFASATRDLVQQYKPVPKFLSVKFVIALSFWQSIIVAGLVAVKFIHATTYWTTDDISAGVQNALLCGEMLIAAIWHMKAFEYKEFDLGMRTPVLASAANAFSPSDIARDIYYSFVTSAAKEMERLNKKKKNFVELAKQEEEGMGAKVVDSEESEYEKDGATVLYQVSIKE